MSPPIDCSLNMISRMQPFLSISTFVQAFVVLWFNCCNIILPDLFKFNIPLLSPRFISCLTVNFLPYHFAHPLHSSTDTQVKCIFELKQNRKHSLPDPAFIPSLRVLHIELSDSPTCFRVKLKPFLSLPLNIIVAQCCCIPQVKILGLYFLLSWAVALIWKQSLSLGGTLMPSEFTACYFLYPPLAFHILMHCVVNPSENVLFGACSSCPKYSSIILKSANMKERGSSNHCKNRTRSDPY